MVKDRPELRRAYKTPSLRGVAGRPPYMHAGQIATLDEVVDHYARAPASEDGHSELNPLTLSERERKELVAFLKTLDPPACEVTRYRSFTVSIATKVEVCATCGSAEMRSPSTRR